MYRHRLQGFDKIVRILENIVLSNSQHPRCGIRKLPTDLFFGSLDMMECRSDIILQHQKIEIFGPARVITAVYDLMHR